MDTTFIIVRCSLFSKNLNSLKDKNKFDFSYTCLFILDCIIKVLVKSEKDKLKQANTVQLFANFKSTHVPMAKNTPYAKLHVRSVQKKINHC